jgi:hypothetical protein
MTGTSSLSCAGAFGIGGEVADWYGNGGWANDVGVATLGTLGGTDSPSIHVGTTFMLGYLAATGTMTMNASSSLTVGAGTSYIADYGNATLTLNDHAAATIAGGLIAGDGPGCVAYVNLNNNAALTVGGDFQLGGGQWGNGFGILTATGASKVAVGGTLYLGAGAWTPTTGAITMGTLHGSDTASFSAGAMNVGWLGGVGYLTMKLRWLPSAVVRRTAPLPMVTPTSVIPMLSNLEMTEGTLVPGV